MPREKSAGAIIFRMEDNVPQYLLLRYERGHWEFPKGHVEAGESEEQTVAREVFEETGIKEIKIIPGFKQYIKYFFRQYPRPEEKLGNKLNQKSLPAGRQGKTPWVFKLVVFFVAETQQKDIKLSHEHTEFIWLPFKEAHKKTTFKNSKILLRKANGFIKNHINGK